MVIFINSLHNLGKVTSISCFDFLTLYTTIPDDKLIKVLREKYIFVLKSATKIYNSWEKKTQDG